MPFPANSRNCSGLSAFAAKLWPRATLIPPGNQAVRRSGRLLRSPQRLGARIAVLVAALSLPTFGAAPRVLGTVSNWTELRNPVWEEAKNPDRHLYSFREVV